MTDWPAAVPFFDLRSGYGAQPGENVLSTPMDIGPAKRRRRTTSSPSTVTGSAYMTKDEAQRFEEFWRATLKDGALSFVKSDGLYRRRNQLTYSEDFSTGWDAGVGLTRTDAVSVIPGATASRFDNDGTTVNRGVSQTVGEVSGSTETLTVLLENISASLTRIGLRDNTDALFYPGANLDWTAETISVVTGAGSASMQSMGIGPNGGALVRASVTGSALAGNVRRSLVYITGVSLNTDAAIIHWQQLEAGSQFSQYEAVGSEYRSNDLTRGGEKSYRIVGVPQFSPMGFGHRVSVTLEVLP